jgi:hypothetical protein
MIIIIKENNPKTERGLNSKIDLKLLNINQTGTYEWTSVKLNSYV